MSLLILKDALNAQLDISVELESQQTLKLTLNALLVTTAPPQEQQLSRDLAQQVNMELLKELLLKEQDALTAQLDTSAQEVQPSLYHAQKEPTVD